MFLGRLISWWLGCEGAGLRYNRYGRDSETFIIDSFFRVVDYPDFSQKSAVNLISYKNEWVILLKLIFIYRVEYGRTSIDNGFRL